MADKYKPLSDARVVALVNEMTASAVSWQDSNLSRERTEVQKHYDAQAPAPAARNNSKYVSQDVYDSTEQAVAALTDVFTGGSGLGRFEAQGAEDVAQTEEATRYCDWSIFRRNPGHDIITTAIRDGLQNRNGIGKVYWDEEETYWTEDFEDFTEDQLYVFFDEQENAQDIEELVQDEDTGLLSGSILFKSVERFVRVENLPPEEFGISRRARSLDDAEVKYHRQLMAREELKDLGLSETALEELFRQGDEEAGEADEVIQRFAEIEGSVHSDEEHVQEQGRKVWVYESYVRLDIDGDGYPRAWKIRHAGSFLIDKEPVDDHPFLAWAPLKRPHSFWGDNWAKRIIPTQNAKTILTRGILDHTVATNRPRYKVLKGTVRSARELMDDRFGGIVNVTRMEGIEPLMQQSLNPFTFQTIQLLDQDKEDSTGVSSLMTGMNSDAVSKQNSFEMINQLTTLSQTRLKLMARNFAEQWVKPMYMKVYRLAIENDDTETVLELNGNYTKVNPSTWKRRKDFTIELAVGYGEKEKEAQKWLGIDALLTQSALPGQYTPQHKFRVLSKALSFMGAPDTENYLAAETPPPQPDPIAMKELELKERELALKERETSIRETELQLKVQRDGAELELKASKQRADFALASNSQDLKEAQHESSRNIAERELAILEKTSTDTKGIASPNSINK